MPRDGSQIYHRPPGTDGIPDTTIESTKYNINVADVEQDLNLPRPIIAGGTGANNARDARLNIDAEVSAQLVTNYDNQVWEAGSFYSDPSATASPIAGHSFSGVCHTFQDGSSSLFLEARDYADPTKHYVRKKQSSIWSAWVIDGDDKVDVTGDTMTGRLTISGVDDGLYLNAPSYSRVRTETSLRAWSVGTWTDGTFVIADENAGLIRLQIGTAGNGIMQGSWTVNGSTQLNGALGVSGVVTFSGSANFNGTATFNTDAAFSNVQINGTFLATSTCTSNGAFTAGSTANFNGVATFFADAAFSHTDFNGTARFNSTATFANTSQFNGVATFAEQVVSTQGHFVAHSAHPSYCVWAGAAAAFCLDTDGAQVYVSQCDGGGIPFKTLGLWNTGGDFQIYGTMAFRPGGGVWNDSSDSRIKNVLGDYTSGLDEILALRPIRYTFKGNDTPKGKPPENMQAVDDNNDLIKAEVKTVTVPYGNSPHHGAATSGKEFVGLIAQEAEVAMPETVTHREAMIDGEAVTDLRDLDSTPIIFALINAVKTLAARVEELEAQQPARR